ncbi:hypothetical protein [Levilactobacillus enshiensis]|uniref:hypothetical protein n=1 Tax=Levilactobacillus enshiensis TaxID=2590213 RepID=UPI00117A88A9|nr:hypothetical protein [Levilactobacillus enshiensis]
MKRRLILLVSVLLVVSLAVSALAWHQAVTPAEPHPTTKTAPKKHNSLRPLTVTELNHNSQLRATCIIYFAVKYTKLQRWQELSDFQLGWQVERYLTHNPDKYLVWPDKNITTAEKNLEPNWFKLTATGNVTYDSMIVHSFRQDQTATTTLTKITRQLNQAHKMATVRRLSHNLSQLTHQSK